MKISLERFRSPKAVGHASIAVILAVVIVLVVVTKDARMTLLFGVPVAFAQLMWGGRGAAAFFAVMAISTAVATRGSLSAMAYPAWTVLLWSAAVIASRGFAAEALKARLAEGKMEEGAAALRTEIDQARQRISSSRQRIEKMYMLTRVAEEMSATLDFKEVARQCLDRAGLFTGQAGVARLVLFDEYGARAFRVDGDLVVAREDPDPFALWVKERMSPLHVSDLTRDFRFRAVASKAEGVRSLVATPLMRGQSVMGVMEARSAEPDAYSPEDGRLLSLLGDLTGVAVQNALLYQKTQEEAITDGLTRLNVHKYFMDRLEEEVRRSREAAVPLSLLMADIDDFKKLNDTYGHLLGDSVLRLIADALREGVRATDLVARYGGEEFSVMLIETPPEGAMIVAQRLRAAVEFADYAALKLPAPVTISIGIASLPKDATDDRVLVEKADVALYAAKRAGKNRVVASE